MGCQPLSVLRMGLVIRRGLVSTSPAAVPFGHTVPLLNGWFLLPEMRAMAPFSMCTLMPQPQGHCMQTVLVTPSGTRHRMSDLVSLIASPSLAQPICAAPGGADRLSERR